MLINKTSSEPVYMQIVSQYKRQISSKVLKAHDQLPSVRKLSYDMGINPNTLQKAYTQLESLGICYSLPGKGRFVSENALNVINSDAESHYKKLSKIIENLALCNQDKEAIISKVELAYEEAIRKLNS